MWSMCNAAERPGSGHDIGTIRRGRDSAKHVEDNQIRRFHSISGLVVEYIVAIDVTRVRFPADAFFRRGDSEHKVSDSWAIYLDS